MFSAVKNFKDVIYMDKKHTFRAPVAIALATVMAAAVLLTGCGDGDTATPDEAQKETRVVTETQIVTKVVDGFYTDENGNPIKDENGQPVSAPAGTPDTDSKQGGSDNNSSSSAANGSNSEAAENNNADGNNSQASNSSGNGSGSKNSSASSSVSSSSSSKSSGGSSDKTSPLTLAGKTYNVGDKVSCTYDLTCKKLMSNFQAYVQYDNKCLKPVDAHLEGPAKAGSVINYELYDQGKIKFNGINLNGYNYTKGDKFLVVDYEVVGGGSTTPEFVWQIATDVKDNALVKDGKPDAAITLNESYS